MIEIEQLWQMIDSRVSARPTEEIPATEAVGRTPATAVMAPLDHPRFDYCAMDGYAFADPSPDRCRVIGRVAAGEIPGRPLTPGTALRVLTGAPVPQGTYAVAKQEDCRVEDDTVSLREPSTLVAGAQIRRRAAIYRAGDPLLQSGHPLGPGGVALLVACGVETIAVVRRPEILHVVTGSELLAPGVTPEPGKIPDSNGPMIRALLASRHLASRQLRLPDDPDALREALGSFGGDLLLVSGGAGPGDRDHTREALETVGYTLHADRVNSRPGKPLVFATRGSQAAFGLPGNPLSHWVCFHAFVRRALDRMEGRPSADLIELHCNHPESDPGDGRRAWTPARIRFRGGRAEAAPLPWLHSGDLSPLLDADLLLLDSPHPASHLVRALIL